MKRIRNIRRLITRACAVSIATALVASALVPLALVPSALWAQDGGTQSDLTSMGVGARELSMGRTGVATSQGADALFWNPAQLAVTQWAELSLFRSQLFVDGVTYHAAFFTYPTLDFGTLALGYQRIGVGDIEARDERNRLLPTFESSESNLLMGYGRMVGDYVSLGGTLRIAQQTVDSASDAGFGLDLGAAFEYGLDARRQHRVRLATNLQNAIEPKLRLAVDEVEDPRNAKLGVAYLGGSGRMAWTASFDVDLPRRADARPGAGVELIYANALALRTGVDRSRPTFGVGIGYGGFRFDYAMHSPEGWDRNDRFTFAMHFGSSVVGRRQARSEERQRLVTEELERRLKAGEEALLQRALAEATQAYEDRAYESALLLYRRALALSPEDAHATAGADAAERQVRLLEASEAFASGAVAQAAAAYQRIAERWPDDVAAREGLAAARNALERSASLANTERALFREALARFTANDLAAAEATLHELLRLSPQHELGRELLANVQTTRAQQGASALEEARRHAARSNWDAALQALSRATAALGQRQDLRALAADWRAQRAVSDRATDAATTPSEDTAPRVRAARRLGAAERAELGRQYDEGLAAFTGGNFERAIRHWHGVWLADPNFRDVGSYLIKAYLFEGVELYGRGQYDPALERCRRVLDIDPENEKARRYLRRIEEEKLEAEQIGGQP